MEDEDLEWSSQGRIFPPGGGIVVGLVIGGAFWAGAGIGFCVGLLF